MQDNQYNIILEQLMMINSTLEKIAENTNPKTKIIPQWSMAELNNEEE
jgi:hypothetical protein